MFIFLVEIQHRKLKVYIKTDPGKINDNEFFSKDTLNVRLGMTGSISP